MTLVHLIQPEEAPLSVRKFFQDGPPGPVSSSLAHVPELLLASMPFISRVFGPSSIDFRTKELVILRTSAQLGCRHCTNTHTAIAMSADFTRRQLLALRGEEPWEEAFPSEKERALLRWTDAVALGPAPVPSELGRRLKAYFEDAEVVELTLLVGATVMLSRYATALGLPISEAHAVLLEKEGLLL